MFLQTIGKIQTTGHGLTRGGQERGRGRGRGCGRKTGSGRGRGRGSTLTPAMATDKSGLYKHLKVWTFFNVSTFVYRVWDWRPQCQQQNQWPLSEGDTFRFHHHPIFLCSSFACQGPPLCICFYTTYTICRARGDLQCYCKKRKRESQAKISLAI